jgi:lipid-binding SYLF domain-containing protein
MRSCLSEGPKAAMGVGGQFGEGALLQKGKLVGYYNTAAASIGPQAGAQQFGYAMSFVKANAVARLNKADGFEVGLGPTRGRCGRGHGEDNDNWPIELVMF